VIDKVHAMATNGIHSSIEVSKKLVSRPIVTIVLSCVSLFSTYLASLFISSSSLFLLASLCVTNVACFTNVVFSLFVFVLFFIYSHYLFQRKDFFLWPFTTRLVSLRPPSSFSVGTSPLPHLLFLPVLLPFIYFLIL